MNLTIEQLKFARQIGATHYDYNGDLYKTNANGKRFWVYIPQKRGFLSEPVVVESPLQIDFTPLDDYYDDKAIDIAATSVPDGYYHDDEEDKLKPLKPASATDMVNHPQHYQTDGIECIDAIRAALGLEGFVAHCRGNAIKYSWRAGKKGETAQDLRKAAWYLNRAATELEKQQ